MRQVEGCFSRNFADFRKSFFMKKIFCFLVVLLIAVSHVNAQHFEGISFYSIKSKSDTIDFIKIGKGGIKPTLIFCQGSLPIPLIVTDQTNYFIPAVNNFDYRKIIENWNIVIISMPSIPVVTEKSNLVDYQYCVDGKFPQKYIENNYLEKYVERGNKVVDFLARQKWVDRKRIYMIGHSQGAQVAIEIAKENKNIAAVGYFSGNVLGRFSQYVLQNRFDEQKGIVSLQEAQKNIERNLEWWTAVCRDSIFLQNGDTNRTWKSFGRESISTITKLRQPVFVAYGTKDIGPAMCDLLPICLELDGKTNYKLYPVVGCGHNFEEFSADGKPDYDKMHWQDVMDEFVKWVSK